MSIRVAILGERALTGGATAGALSPRAMALLGYLVLQVGRPQPRARLAALFWPDSSDAQALTNLRRELHAVRRALGEQGGLVVTARELCWVPSEDVSVDLLGFIREEGLAWGAMRRSQPQAALAHADRALADCTGELLPGLYDDWLTDAREDLQRRCVRLCDLICEVRQSLGDPAGALDAARRRIKLEPLDERGYRQLMEIQLRTGDRGGALTTYHRCAEILEREMQLSPGPEVRAVLARLMAEPGEGPTDNPPRPLPSKRPVGDVPLVGRSPVMRTLMEAYGRAMEGGAGAVMIRGDAGVGKTRLAEELARRAAAEGSLVARAQCFATSGRLSLAPVAD